MGHGSISFNESITLYEPNGSITVRNMNPDGTFYDAEQELYEEDGSLHLSENNEGELSFMDALQEQLNGDDEIEIDYENST